MIMLPEDILAILADVKAKADLPAPTLFDLVDLALAAAAARAPETMAALRRQGDDAAIADAVTAALA